MSLKFQTPEDAELAFYDAMETGDIEKMKQVWSDDESIVCIHPGAMRIEGREEVVGSFSQIFEEAPEMDYSVGDSRCLQSDDVAVHLVREELVIDDQLVSVMLATNIYHKIDGSWRMTLHHASHEPDPDYDELDYPQDTEVPIVLH